MGIPTKTQTVPKLHSLLPKSPHMLFKHAMLHMSTKIVAHPYKTLTHDIIFSSVFSLDSSRQNKLF